MLPASLHLIEKEKAMNRMIINLWCTLVIVALLGYGAIAQVQFQVPLTVTNGALSQPLVIGVSGDGPGGLPDNTIGVDVDTTYGLYTEVLAPPAPPPPFGFDARLMTIPGRVSTYPTGLGGGVYADYRGWSSYVQADTFKVLLDGSDVESNTTTISWPAGLGTYGSTWTILPLAGGWAPVNMIANQTVVVPAAGLGITPVSILIIKTGAGPAGPAFTLEPTFLNFGSVAVGDTSAVQNATVTNPGTTNGLNVSVSPNAQYLVTPSSVVIPAAGSQVFSIRYAPTSPVPGGNLVFTHNAPGSPDTLYCVANGADTSKFLTLSPDTLIAKDPVKGKFLKSAKRGKGLKPNWANLLEETVVQGGFQPNATGSDIGGGMVVGLSFVENVAGKVKAIKDSAKIHGWVRNTKWKLVKGGSGYADLQKTIEDKTGKQTGAAAGLQVFVSGKPFLKEVKAPAPKKFNNKLYAELVALKFNIAASQLGKTPIGFGELIFDRDGNSFDELSVLRISEQADTLMTYYGSVAPGTFDSLYSVVHDINRAFLGAMDTISFEVGAQLKLHGVANTTTFLKSPVGPVAPILLAAVTSETEESPEFEDGYGDDDEAMPVAAKLYQNYPNPFNPSTTISFRLREASVVTISVFNMLGQQVATLVSGEELEQGIQAVDFSASTLASGAYFYRIDAQSVETGTRAVETQKMMLLK
jgi:hypothetical protein